jgi:hypothetical protein
MHAESFLIVYNFSCFHNNSPTHTKNFSLFIFNNLSNNINLPRNVNKHPLRCVSMMTIQRVGLIVKKVFIFYYLLFSHFYDFHVVASFSNRLFLHFSFIFHGSYKVSISVSCNWLFIFEIKKYFLEIYI